MHKHGSCDAGCPESSKTDYPMSCSEWYKSGHTQSGEYIIDPDKDCCLQPFTVQCDMNHMTPVTIITHSQQECHLVNNIEFPGDFIDGKVEYSGVSYEQVRELVVQSAKCWYFYNQTCVHSKTKYDYWRSYSNAKIKWKDSGNDICPGEC